MTPSATRPPTPAAPASAAAAPAPRQLSSGRALLLPSLFAAGLLAFIFLPPLQANPRLFWSFVGAAAVLAVWTAVLWVTRERETLGLVVALRKHHWVQACAQMVVIGWWGWHVAGVYAFVPLIVGQLLFAYGFEALLNWTRRGTHALGFGPFPIILSINLFLWFKEDWFYWQFAMIAVGYLAKDLIRWRRDGRSAHIFNPSSFPLGLAAIALIAVGMTDITWGVEIAQTQFNPPHMYLVIFLVALPGMLLFGVTTMTMAAVVTTYLFSLAYLKLTGTYFFFDSYIPLPVFLGMHLLFTDPSTSPRTESGRIFYGVLYGMGTVVCYALLSAAGLPRFYDKLIPVPLMNLTVRGIDRMARSDRARAVDVSRVGRALSPPARRVSYTALWAGVFVALTAAGGVGDDHPGQWFPFWQQACAEGSVRACDHVADKALVACERGSGWACNEWAIYLAENRLPNRARASFERACELGFPPACGNVDAEPGEVGAAGFARGRPLERDLPIILTGSKGPLPDRPAVELYPLACAQGWPEWCGERAEAGR